MSGNCQRFQWGQRKPIFTASFDRRSVADGTVAAQRSPCSYPWNLRICYVSWHRWFEVVDGIKVADQMTLKWVDYPGLPRWAQSNHKGPSTWNMEAERPVLEWCDVRKTCWLWRGKGETLTKEYEHLLEGVKGKKKWILLVSLWKGLQ